MPRKTNYEHIVKISDAKRKILVEPKYPRYQFAKRNVKKEKNKNKSQCAAYKNVSSYLFSR